MQVQTKSPVDPQQQPYLTQWDESARRYHNFFEASKQTASENLKLLKGNTFTSFRDVIQTRGRHTKIDELTLRQ